jgi:hypothetical protein
MKVICRTNLDLQNEKWPTDLSCLPHIGDEIESAILHGGGEIIEVQGNGEYKYTGKFVPHFRLSLVVVGICFKHIRTINEDYGEHVYAPEIELNIRNGWSIRDFYEWYAPKVGKTVSAFI